MSAASDKQNVKCGIEQGGARMFVKSGAELDIESGGAFKIAGVAVGSTAAEINANAGVSAGTATASKAVVLDANKAVDVVRTASLRIGTSGSEVDKTNVVIGAAAGIKINASATPLALDGSNPTSFAHGLTTCTSAFAQLVGSAAPGDSTSVLTCVINGANVDVYAWKNTGGTDPTLVASTGTETFNWVVAGT